MECIGANLFEMTAPDPVQQQRVSKRTPIAQEVFRTGKFTTFEDVQNGRVWEHAIYPIFNPEGEVVELCIIDRDITLQKKKESQYRDTKSQLDFTLESCHIGTWSLDVRSKVIEHSLEHDHIFGYASAQQEWNFEIFLDHVIPEDRPILELLYHEHLAGEATTGDIQFRIRRADGKLRWLQQVNGTDLDENGELIRILGVTKDITEFKEDERKLLELRSQWDFTVNNCQVGMWKLDLKTMTSIRNSVHARIFGYEPADTDWSFQIFLEHVLSDDRQWVEPLIRESLANKKDYRFECRICRKDDEIRWINVIAAFQYDDNGNALDLIGIIQDITEQQQSKAEHQSTLVQLNFTLDKLHLGAWTLDLQSGAIHATDEHARIFGYSKQPEWNLELFFSHIIPEDLPKFKQLVPDIIDDPRDWINDYRIRRVDGNIRWLRDIGRVSYDSNGKALQLIGVVIDITDQKIIEDELFKSKERLSQALSATQSGVWEYNKKEGSGYWSDEVYRLYGLEHNEEFQTFDYWSNHILHPEDREIVVKAIKQSFITGDNVNQEFRICRPDGSIRWILCRGTAHLDESGLPNHLIGTLIDITEMKQAAAERDVLQQQLQQSQKMELVGQLAGGIAHDFNNSLTAILGNTELAQKMLEKHNVTCKNLDSIRHSATRSAETVKHLLAFARKQPMYPQSVLIDDELKKMRLILDNLIRENIQFRWNLKSLPHRVSIDPSCLIQIITNLVVNARDAISDGGVISIETDIAKTGECNWSAVNYVGSVDDLVSISVSDTGGGISQETLPHIFEPFFTTKEIGKGTGLGLSTVYGLVHQNGGVITCQSEIEKGTTFRILFPIIQIADTKPESPTNELPDITSDKLVLVVEDQPEILSIITLILEQQGLRALSTENAEDALRIFEDHGYEIDIVISDIMMAGMNGIQMSREMAKMNPSTKFIFMSGYTADALGSNAKLEESTKFISKPFEISDFLSIVKSMLN